MHTARSLARRPAAAARVLRDTWPVLKSAGRALELGALTLGSPRGEHRGEAPRTRFNRQIGPRRSYTFGSLPLSDPRPSRTPVEPRSTMWCWVSAPKCCGATCYRKGSFPDRPFVAGVPMATTRRRGPWRRGNQVIFLRLAAHRCRRSC